MVFIGIYRGIYDYTAQDANEITIKEGDLLCVLEKGDDGWWKVKQKAVSNDDEEPEGLVPANYIEQAKSIGTAKALYDYTRQTDEELSLVEDAALQLYDTSDSDWTLVGLGDDYGFVPANYLELEVLSPLVHARPRSSTLASLESLSQFQPALPARPQTTSLSASPMNQHAATLAGAMNGRGPADLSVDHHNHQPIRSNTSESIPSRKRVQFFAPTPDDESSVPRPARRSLSSSSFQTISSTPRIRNLSMRESSDRASVISSSSLTQPAPGSHDEDENTRAWKGSGGFRMYNIFEIVEALGKNRKNPVTLGLNIAKGIIGISSEGSRETKEWSADKLTNYSIEGKHVFMELVRPSRSIDFHAGAKETAQEIVIILGELSGAVKAADGLRDIFSVGAGSQKLGRVLYNFSASAHDEVSVKAEEEVIIVDDTKSEEWWLVRRLKNGKEGKEGMVPRSYVEVTGTLTTAATAAKASSGNRTFFEKILSGDERQPRETSQGKDQASSGLSLPQRGSSLWENGQALFQRPRESRESREAQDSQTSRSSKRSVPDAQKIRTWTDRTGSFKVEAEFLGLRDGKINLHKANGVKIAVPMQKMSPADIEYIESFIGKPLDDERSLSDLKRAASKRQPSATISISQPPQYDWFDFFLQCGVSHQICERYAQAFTRDEMGEENMPDITPTLLRNLGLKEGDILRVMKFLDTKYNRTKATSPSQELTGGLFSGPGGTLLNKTGRRTTLSRPIKDIVDAKVFDQSEPAPESTATVKNDPPSNFSGGFDDEAWALRESKNMPEATIPVTQPPKSQPLPPATAASTAQADLLGLSLSTPPLQPVPATPRLESTPDPTPPVQETSPPGATPSLFDQLTKLPTYQAQISAPRQRPVPPLQTQSRNLLIVPPPPRAASAPLGPQSAFQPPPLQPQLTGYPAQPPMQTQIFTIGQGSHMLNQHRQYQQHLAMMPQQTGFQPMGSLQRPNNSLTPQFTGFPIFQPTHGMSYLPFQQPQPTGYPPSMQQQFPNGLQTSSPFADSAASAYQPTQPQPTGINSFLPPPLIPQQTGPAPVTSFNMSGSMHLIPPFVSANIAVKPLIPQQTGPPPPVKFGVGSAKKLAPQPTGRRANLSAATPDNPFGF